MRLFLTLLIRFVAILLILGFSVWGAGATHYEFPGGNAARVVAPAVVGLLGLLAAIGVFLKRVRPALALFAVATLGLLVWWGTILPSNDREFAPEVSRLMTGRFDGESLTVANVRDFEWRSSTDFTPRWKDESYDLDSIRSIDLFMTYWMGPKIAHPIVSFGFADGRRLAFSIEIRRRKYQEFSTIGGFFKQFDLIFIGADERDLLGLRERNNEKILLFHLRAGPEEAHALLTEYLAQANSLAEAPQFYNTVTANCTTEIFLLLRRLTNRFPLDWRIILNGFLPEYLYDHDVLNRAFGIEELRQLGDVSGRFRQGVDSVAFSSALREGVPPAPVARPAP
jgi:Domain of unknown function (DUF4105)